MCTMKHFSALVTLLFVLPSASIADWYLLPSPTSANVSSISSLNKDTLYICCSNGGVYRTMNGGMNWTLIRNIGSNTRIQFINFSTGFLASSPYLLKTTNAGMNWNAIGSPCYFSFINENTGWMICGDSLVRRTTNSGVTWEIHAINAISGSYGITGIAALSSDSAIVTVQQTISFPEIHSIAAFKTINGGINWTGTFGHQQISGLPTIGPIYFFDNNHGWFHAFHRIIEWFMYHYVYISGDGGNGWAGVQFTDVITFGFGSPSTGWASSIIGMYYTTNSGFNWTLKTIPTSNTIGTISMINEYTGYCAGDVGTILKTTDGGGIFTFISKNESYTNAFSLSQNYPNPFNPVTKIKFSIPPSKGVSGMINAKLVIYDVLGRVIETLIPPVGGGQEGLSPGTYEVEWNGIYYPSGVYFYRLVVSGAEPLITEGYSETKRMVLLK